MVSKTQTFKYEKPFKGLCENYQIWTNKIVTIQMGVFTARLNILRINLLTERKYSEIHL